MTDSAQVQDAVDRLAELVGQSVLIEDTNKTPLWWSVQGRVDGTRMTSILQRRADPRALAVVNRLKLSRAEQPVHTPALPEADMWARWCMPVRHDGRHLGFVWVLDPDDTIGQEHLPLIVECADLAAAVMVRSVQTAEQVEQVRRELLERLLRGPDEAAARALARAEHLAHDVRVQVHAPRRPGGWPLPDDMCVHVAGPRARPATSGTPLPLLQLAEAVRRAGATRRAMAAGADLASPSWDDLGAWRLVIDAGDDLTVAEIHPGAEVLAGLPRPDLMNTARVVLDHGGDVAAAAQALHLHRTTLYYRFDRILELTGVDLRDGRSRTDLHLALWLAAYRRAGKA